MKKKNSLKIWLFIICSLGIVVGLLAWVIRHRPANRPDMPPPPAVLVISDSTSQTFLNNNGEIVEDAQGEALYSIKTDSLDKLDISNHEAEIIWLINWFNALKINSLACESSKLNGWNILEQKLTGGPIIIISPNKDNNQQLDPLLLILSMAKINNQIPREIDLRFDKPIIKYD